MEEEYLLNIKFVNNFNLKSLDFIKSEKNLHYYYFNGFIINTNKQNIYVLLDNHSNCCENWYYFFEYFNNNFNYNKKILRYDFNNNIDELNNKFNDIIGSTNKIFINSKKILPTKSYEIDNYFIIFELNTSYGIFNFSLNTIHNGYYPHYYLIKFDNIEDYDKI